MISIKRVCNVDEMKSAWMIREEVFVKAQKVPKELEMDEYDDVALHVIAYIDGELAGTGRIYKDPSNASIAKLGRVAVLHHMRRKGVASAIIRELLEYACEEMVSKVVLHSQSAVVDVYKKFGFKSEGDPFEEAGIEHIQMKLDLLSPELAWAIPVEDKPLKVGVV